MKPTIDIGEAERAIEMAKALHSNLTSFGFGVHDQWKLSRAEIAAKITEGRLEFEPAQVATAMAFLRQCSVGRKPNWSSYRLKHLAENWGARNDMESYVTNGALLVAGIALEIPMQKKRGEPNARFALDNETVPGHQKYLGGPPLQLRQISSSNRSTSRDA